MPERRPACDTYLAFGANLGDRQAAIRAGVAALQRRGIEPLGFSSLYASRAKYVVDQPGFLNCVGLFRTSLTPRALLTACQAVERAAGRERRERFGPRELDIDILLYGDRVIHEKGLDIPHPAIGERLFVLAPLAEIAPSLTIPGLGPVTARLERAQAELPPEEGVRRLGALTRPANAGTGQGRKR